MVISIGEEPKRQVQTLELSAARRDRGIILHGQSIRCMLLHLQAAESVTARLDFLNVRLIGTITPAVPALTECEFYNKLERSTYAVNGNDGRMWRDLPQEHVQLYSADWIVILPGVNA